jgi:hypothetical protein
MMIMMIMMMMIHDIFDDAHGYEEAIDEKNEIGTDANDGGDCIYGDY